MKEQAVCEWQELTLEAIKNLPPNTVFVVALFDSDKYDKFVDMQVFIKLPAYKNKIVSVNGVRSLPITTNIVVNLYDHYQILSELPKRKLRFKS